MLISTGILVSSRTVPVISVCTQQQCSVEKCYSDKRSLTRACPVILKQRVSRGPVRRQVALLVVHAGYRALAPTARCVDPPQIVQYDVGAYIRSAWQRKHQANAQLLARTTSFGSKANVKRVCIATTYYNLDRTVWAVHLVFMLIYAVRSC